MSKINGVLSFLTLLMVSLTGCSPVHGNRVIAPEPSPSIPEYHPTPESQSGFEDGTTSENAPSEPMKLYLPNLQYAMPVVETALQETTAPLIELPALDPSEATPVGCPEGCETHKPGCDIKGNISFTTGAKIYHDPGGEYYQQTEIAPDFGERWFCTEEEAVANGWRKSKR